MLDWNTHPGPKEQILMSGLMSALLAEFGGRWVRQLEMLKLYLAQLWSLQVLTGTPHSLLSASNSAGSGNRKSIFLLDFLLVPPIYQLPVATKVTFGKCPAAGRGLK